MNSLLAALELLLVVALGATIGLVLHWLLFRLARRFTTDLPDVVSAQDILFKHVHRPLAVLLPLIAVRLCLPLAQAPVATAPTVESLLHIGVVAAVAWLLISGVDALEELLVARSSIEQSDNLEARKMLTQAKILKRIAVVAIGTLALAAILMHYETFREIGTGLLASAGVAGLVIGLAAQRTLGNLLAGIQIAITQPIRVDDVVIVEGDFGWVDEITLTYVVVRVWDERRIVVPISDFIEKPFQNWTRTSSKLLGTVFLYVDYTVPVEALREAHQRILDESDGWDQRAAAVQVTDARERTVEVRLLQSAVDAGTLFGLRCEVREKMIAFMQREYPDALPKVRAEMHPAPAGNGQTDDEQHLMGGPGAEAAGERQPASS